MRSGIGGCVLQSDVPVTQVEARSEAVGLDLGLKTVGHDERWGEARGGTLLPQHRGEDRPRAAPRPQAPGEATSSYGGATAKECLTSVFEENRRPISNDRRGRCECTASLPRRGWPNPCWTQAGECSKRNCSTRASRPAGVFGSSAKDTQRKHAAAAELSRVPQVWTCWL